MNTRRRSERLKAAKRGFKTKTEDGGEAEVFVLPPDLLLKLGINLTSVRSTQESSENVTSHHDENKVSTEQNGSYEINDSTHNCEALNLISGSFIQKESHIDSSIIETASLMKKSVFLSPTFLTDSINNDPGELEISNVINPENLHNEINFGKNLNSTTASHIKKVVDDKTLPEINNLSDILAPQLNDTDISGSKNESDIFNCNLISLADLAIATQEMNKINDNNISDKLLKSGVTDDHTNAAYLSDCNNSNSGPSDIADSSVNHNPEIRAAEFEIPNVLYKKVQIISEEIISPSKLKDFGMALTPKSNFIPISTNCVLASKNVSHYLFNNNNAVSNTHIDYSISSIHKGDKDDFVVLYDEEGNVITTLGNNVPRASIVKPTQNEANTCDTITSSNIKDFSPITDQIEISNQLSGMKPHMHDNSLEDLDLTVIDMEIEENEDILENFVNDMTSNDDNKIIEKIEQSENESPAQSQPEKEILLSNRATDLQNIRLSCCDMADNKCNSLEIVTNRIYGDIQFKTNVVLADTKIGSNITVGCAANEPNEHDKVNHYNIIQADLGIKQQSNSTNIQKNYTDGLHSDIDHIEDTFFGTESICLEQNTINSLTPEDNQTRFPELLLNPYKMMETESFVHNNTSISAITVVNEKSSTNSDKIDKADHDFIHVEPKMSDCLPLTKQTQDFLHLEKLEKETKEQRENIKHLTSFVESYIVDDVKNNENIVNVSETDIEIQSNKEIIKNVPDDRIKEIALYLCQFAKNKSRSEKLQRIPEKNTELSAKRSKYNALTSKLCIQGVEKPGGSEKSNKEYKSNKVLKTYSRADKAFKQPVSLSIPNTSGNEHQVLCFTIDEQESNSSIRENGSKKTEFCLCEDYGRLANYDSNYPYMHIHFWEQKVEECDFETVFSIYDDKPDIKIDTNVNDVLGPLEDKTTETPINLLPSICWHSCKKDLSASKILSSIDSGVHRSERHKMDTFYNINTANESNHVLKPDQISRNKLDLHHKSLETSGLIIDTQPSTSKTSNIGENVEAPHLEDIQSSAQPNYELSSRSVPHKEVSNKAVNKNNSKKIDLSDRKLNQDNLIDRKSVKEDTVEIISKPAFEEKVIQTNWSEKNIPLENYSNTTCSTKVKQKASSIADVKNNKQVVLSERALNEGKESAKGEIAVTTSKPVSKKKNNKVLAGKIPPLEKKMESSVEMCSVETDYQQEDDNQASDLKSVDKINTVEDNPDRIKKETCTDNIIVSRSRAKKRKVEEQEDDEVVLARLASKKPIKCDVCKNIVSKSEWDNHVSVEHCFIAWKCGSSFDFLEPSLLKKIRDKLKTSPTVKCTFCSSELLQPKKFLEHVQKCFKKLNHSYEESSEVKKTKTKKDSINKNTPQLESTSADQIVAVVPESGKTDSKDLIKCGVCKETVVNNEWMEHITKKHEYLAWKEGDSPLNLDDEESLRLHLMNIVREIGKLKCPKCDIIRKYPKSYMQHVKYCTGVELSEVCSVNEPTVGKVAVGSSSSKSNPMSKCGVCGKEVWSEKWTQHIGKAHCYMAWKEGESLDVNNEEEVYRHLYDIIKKDGHLMCSRCGTVRKYVKSFLQHTKTCDELPSAEVDDDNLGISESEQSNICALCNEEVDPKIWNQHKMEKHYNVAWTIGSYPVDFRNSNVVDNLLKEYVAKYKKMICKTCGASRVSRIGFYAHVIACGKTEEELEIHKNMCKICEKKYLAIYHNQHMAWHTQQGYAKERKLKEEQVLELKQKQDLAKETEAAESPSGRRRAAVKARNIIEKIKNEDFSFKCPKCKFATDSELDLSRHICKLKDIGDFSGSEDSVKPEDYSEAESDDTIEGDSDASRDEEANDDGPKKKKRSHTTSYQVHRFTHAPKNLAKFLAKSGAEFHEKHFVSGEVFPNFRVFECDTIPESRVQDYLPVLEESCRIQIGDNNWKTYKRFGAERKKVEISSDHAKVLEVCHAIFTGGCIQCVSWAAAGPGGNYLAVACHRGIDIARMAVDDTAAHPGLIQLWDFGNFKKEAEFVFGLAHDYGTAWSMDWCPSGARDELPDEPAAGNLLRLGLLAVAFSSGRVVVYSVPYPSHFVKCNKLIHKLKPVAELRMSGNSERKKYQATSICWSTQKPYDTIVVGYGDGSTAHFDLNTESPLLRETENDVVIIYPYYDERVHISCVTGVGLYPSGGASGGVGASCSSSVTGGALCARPAARPARARYHAHTALAAAAFQPLWPSAALAGDDANMSTSLNELEWFGGGRRMGGCSAGAGCRHCGLLALAALPLLRARYPHPADNLPKKKVLGVLQIKPIVKKQRKLVNDELQTKLEPMTYEEAIIQYGIELRIDKKSINTPREAPERFPERYPLGDVTSMAFCPDEAYHWNLAVGTHCGILFVIHT